MQVFELQDQDTQEWDNYVCSASQASVFHLSGWRDLMQDTFGLRSHFLFARKGDKVLGVLPLLHIKSRISGHFLTSMPGALCAEDDRAAGALIERAKELVKSRGADYLVLRDSYHRWDFPQLITNEDHCTLLVKLHADPEQIWSELDKRVKQSTKKGFRAELDVSLGLDHLDDFYLVYAQAMHDLGTPSQGADFFSHILSRFPRHFNVMLVRKGDQVLGGGLVAFFKDTIYNTWGGMLRQFYDLRPAYVLYWETLKYGCENGFEWVDLGRSEWDSGTFGFKRHWLAEPRPLYQQFFLNGISRPPSVGGGRADDAEYRIFVNAWRRLPLFVTELLGPWLRKRMPFG